MFPSQTVALSGWCFLGTDSGLSPENAVACRACIDDGKLDQGGLLQPPLCNICCVKLPLWPSFRAMEFFSPPSGVRSFQPSHAFITALKTRFRIEITRNALKFCLPSFAPTPHIHPFSHHCYIPVVLSHVCMYARTRAFVRACVCVRVCARLCACVCVCACKE